MFFVSAPPEHIQRERQKARGLRKSSWWLQKLQQGTCYYCDEKFLKDELSMDHKVPLSRGGVSSKNNIVLCCKSCNTQKQSTLSVDFID